MYINIKFDAAKMAQPSHNLVIIVVHTEVSFYSNYDIFIRQMLTSIDLILTIEYIIITFNIRLYSVSSSKCLVHDTKRINILSSKIYCV